MRVWRDQLVFRMSQCLFQDLEQLRGFCMREGAPSPFLTSSHTFCPAEPTNLAATASLAHNYQDRDDAKTWYSTLIFSVVHQIFLVLLSSRHMIELHFLGPYGWVGPCDQTWPMSMSKSDMWLFWARALNYLYSFFLAPLGLCCCAQAFTSCSERGLFFIAVHGLLIVVASLCCGAWALGAWASVVAACGLQ